jgi:hypothetical protein
MIRAAIAADCGGFLATNQLVIGALRDWMAEVGRAALERLPQAERRTSRLLPGIARLPEDLGRLGEAKVIFGEALDRALGGAPTDHTLVTELQALGYPLLACRTAARVVTSEHKDAGRAAWLEAGKAWLQDKVDKGELKAPMPKTAPVPAPAPPAPTAAEVAKARRMAAHTAAEKLKAEKPSNRPAANAFALLLNEDDNADDDDEDDEEDDEEDADEDNDKEK